MNIELIGGEQGVVSILEPNVNEIGERMIKCPNCGEIHSFKIFYTNLALSLGGVSLLPFKRKYTALCLGCKSIFNIESKVGDKYLINRDTPITPENLRKRRGNNA